MYTWFREPSKHHNNVQIRPCTLGYPSPLVHLLKGPLCRNEPKQFRRNKRGRWGSETTTHMDKNDASTIVVRINDGLLMVY